jgi:glucose/arabinose dehydrogenase
VSGRLSRLQADPTTNKMSGPEQVLIEDWCQQYPSHSVGSIVFGSDGALYVSAGDGASYNFTDYGQDGNPLNPCGDPPGGLGQRLRRRKHREGRYAARTCAPALIRSPSTERSCG